MGLVGIQDVITPQPTRLPTLINIRSPITKRRSFSSPKLSFEERGKTKDESEILGLGFQKSNTEYYGNANWIIGIVPEEDIYLSRNR